MIVYNLKCACKHEFEVWFRNSQDYDEQRAADAVQCPACNGTSVEKALMAPNIAPRKSEARSGTDSYIQGANPMREMMKAVHKEITDNCDYVGDTFAKEARAIHEGKSEERNIYGEATPKEAKELIEDGIEVAAIPNLPKSDA